MDMHTWRACEEIQEKLEVARLWT